MKAREINATIRYTMWSVFRRASRPATRRAQNAAWALRSVESATPDSDLVIRGWYDVAGLRADADLMVWWHASRRRPCRTPIWRFAAPVWVISRSRSGPSWPCTGRRSSTRAMCPRSCRMRKPKAHLCVYPFVRSYEWYLLPEQERRAMLAEHGMLARPYPDVRANTVSAFALGDYEWMLAFEADELHRIVDLMRDLRAAAARRHTREEFPFFTGRRRELEEILASW